MQACADLCGAMTSPSDPDLSDAQSRAIAAGVREALARKRMSREQLAHAARISLSTLEKALAGRRPFTLATTVRLEEALGAALRPEGEKAGQGALAPESLGAYARPAVAWLEGAYLTLRPSFDTPAALYAYRTEIAWDAGAACLAFRESERLDAGFTQSGVVALPNQSGHVYLVTNRQGQHRLIILGRPTVEGELHGLLATLHAGRGSQLTPVSAPIVLAPLRDVAEPAYGLIGPDHAAYASSRSRLRRTLDGGYARLLGE